MKSCEWAGEPFVEPRSHPWVDAVANAECRYYDLKVCPEHIRTSLEDFVPWSRYAAVHDFYALLAWLNHPRSLLETNDCAFTGPEHNEHQEFHKRLQCTGRVMVLFRDLLRNTQGGQTEALATRLHRELAEIDTQLEWGMIGTTIIPVRYLELNGQLGSQLMISFWAWGNSTDETMRHLQRVLSNLRRALVHLAKSLA